MVSLVLATRFPGFGMGRHWIMGAPISQHISQHLKRIRGRLLSSREGEGHRGGVLRCCTKAIMSYHVEPCLLMARLSRKATRLTARRRGRAGRAAARPGPAHLSHPLKRPAPEGNEKLSEIDGGDFVGVGVRPGSRSRRNRRPSGRPARVPAARRWRAGPRSHRPRRRRRSGRCLRLRCPRRRSRPSHRTKREWANIAWLVWSTTERSRQRTKNVL